MCHLMEQNTQWIALLKKASSMCLYINSLLVLYNIWRTSLLISPWGYRKHLPLNSCLSAPSIWYSPTRSRVYYFNISCIEKVTNAHIRRAFVQTQRKIQSPQDLSSCKLCNIREKQATKKPFYIYNKWCNSVVSVILLHLTVTFAHSL